MDGKLRYKISDVSCLYNSSKNQDEINHNIKYITEGIFLNLEEIYKSITESITNIRILQEISELNLNKLITNKISNEEYIKITKKDKNIQKYTLHIDNKLHELNTTTELLKILSTQLSSVDPKYKNMNMKENIDESFNEKSNYLPVINEVRCFYGGCTHCIEKSIETYPPIDDFKNDENDIDVEVDYTPFSYCLYKCVWCNKMRKGLAGNNEEKKEIDIIENNTNIKSDNYTSIDELPPAVQKYIADKKPPPIKRVIMHKTDNLTITKEEDESEYIMTNDKYFEVVLDSLREDGSNKHIIDQFTRNFFRMFPKCHPAKAWMFGIEHRGKEPPRLYGIIRYDSNGKYRICPKSDHIQNGIVSEYTEIKNERKIVVDSWTVYQDKEYKTKKSKIIELYTDIKRKSIIKGSKLEDFL